MTAVQVTAWMSEAGNYHANQEDADADTMERALSRPTETKTSLPLVTIYVTKSEQAQVVGVLKTAAMAARQRGKMLMSSIRPEFAGKYHPNRELSRSWDDQAEALRNLAYRVEDQS